MTKHRGLARVATDFLLNLIACNLGPNLKTTPGSEISRSGVLPLLMPCVPPGPRVLEAPLSSPSGGAAAVISLAGYRESVFRLVCSRSGDPQPSAVRAVL